MSELDYINGQRSAWQRLLREALRELRGESSKELDAARLVTEREEAIAILRSACENFGDNDWNPDLHLADIIEKHLVRHLR